MAVSMALCCGGAFFLKARENRMEEAAQFERIT